MGAKKKKETPAVQSATTLIAPKTFNEGSIEALSDELWNIIPRASAIEMLAEGHDWTEGAIMGS